MTGDGERAAPDRSGAAEARQNGDRTIDPGDEGRAETRVRRHGPAIAVDDIGPPGGQRRDQPRQPPGLRPDIGIEQDDIGIVGAQPRQRGEEIGAFLAAQRRQAGDDQLDIQLRDNARQAAATRA